MTTYKEIFGKQIKVLIDNIQDAGFKSVQWDGSDSMGRPVSAGVYLCQIQAGEFVQTRKMVLLKQDIVKKWGWGELGLMKKNLIIRMREFTFPYIDIRWFGFQANVS